MSGKNKIITHDGVDRRYKLCRCIVCGETFLCTPSCDFYSEEPGGPLKCEGCLFVNLKAVGLNLGGSFYKMKPGTKVRVIKGLLCGEQGVVNRAGLFYTLDEIKSSPCIIVDIPSKIAEKGIVTIRKLAGDLEIIL